MNQLDSDYLNLFKPAQSNSYDYIHFQDFFTRKLKSPIQSTDLEPLWPCEGYICEHDEIKKINYTYVKNQKKSIEDVFSISSFPLHQDYFYTNIFLHNHNYHRIHSPIHGVIKSIQKIPGHLNVLRPWAYLSDKSSPAFHNERFNLQIEDTNGLIWYLSIIGGFGVGTIQLAENIQMNSAVKAGEELALFKLGSTCCMAIPYPIVKQKYLTAIEAGQKIQMKDTAH